MRLLCCNSACDPAFGLVMLGCAHLSACSSATAWNCTMLCLLCTASCTSLTQRLMISEFCRMDSTQQAGPKQHMQHGREQEQHIHICQGNRAAVVLC